MLEVFIMNLELVEILLLLKVFIIIWLKLQEEFTVTTLKDPLQLLGLLLAYVWDVWHLLMMDCIWCPKVTLLDSQGHWPPLAGRTIIEMEGQEYLVTDIGHWMMRLVSINDLTLIYKYLNSQELCSCDWKHSCSCFSQLHFSYITLIEIFV